MDTFCLVLAGDHLDHDAEASESRLAAAFGMTPSAFRENVWQRAPLIIRRALDEATAVSQAGQLQQMGAAAAVHVDHGALIWLLRGERVLGPLPAAARAAYARAGDRWCHDGDASWQDLPSASPPPLPANAALLPPPLPGARPVRRRRSTLAWLGGLAAAVLLLALWAHHHASPPAPARRAVTYVPRPLQPMVADAPASTTTCPAGPAPTGEEDRFLLTGGERQLTGRAQRSTDAYVAEAVLQRDAQCQPSAVQLYVFRHGAFVGTAMDAPIDPRRTQLLDFSIDEQGQLGYRLRRCDGRSDRCDEPEAYQARLQRGHGGWVVAYGAADAPAAVEIISRPPPDYPAEAVRQRHEGTVLLLLTIDTDGLPQEIAVAQSSGFAELDAAAVASARKWRFRALRSDGGATTATARVPVRFHLESPTL
ncbi:energy transducer TonB [Dyella sp.]|jgi:TonB family protein|uniref:energy transducer TonB n=1 Tax=Dyella sp. TaxID=1869338 RepID=UPI002D766B1F|nr:energy transducer TonB [Dyella sp.]HET6431143.1 energy transducer TonB [Dyella sp.]